MIDMHAQYDKIHTNEIFHALICINNNVNSCINFMLSNAQTHISKNDTQLFDFDFEI